MRKVLFIKVRGKAAITLTGHDSPDKSEGEKFRQAAFEGFPNIKTPRDLAETYGHLAQYPIRPRFCPKSHEGSIEELSADELLDACDIKKTRTKKTQADDLLAMYSHIPTDYLWGINYLEVQDCVYMSQDMKGLLSILLYLDGRCTPDALRLNTENGFAFLAAYGYTDGSSYIEHMRPTWEDIESGDFEVMVEELSESLAKAYLGPAENLPGSTKRSLGKFVEDSVNVLMASAHPMLLDGEFFPMGNGSTLGDIYAYWLQQVIDGKVLVCGNCGKIVAGARKDQKYCSNSCKVTASQRRNKS